MGPTTASTTASMLVTLAEQLRDGSLLDFDQGENLVSALDSAWPTTDDDKRVEWSNSWDAAKELLFMASTGSRSEEFPPEFVVVREYLAELVSAIGTVKHAEYSPDGHGARFRDFGPVVHALEQLRRAIPDWETSMLGASDPE